MKTNTSCIPCFLRQANETLDRINISESEKKVILKAVNEATLKFPLIKVRLI